VFSVGESIQIVGYLDKRKLKANVLGWADGDYIVLSYPTTVQDNEEVSLPKDAAIMCRAMVDGRLHGFRSQVLHSMSQPFELLFVVYPSGIEDLSGDKSFRLEMEISAKATVASGNLDSPPSSAKSYDVAIQYLSATGAVLQFPNDEELDPFDTVFLTCQLPDGASVENLKVFPREEEKFEGTSTVGVDFNDEDPDFAPVFDFLIVAHRIISQMNA
jgi:hypothetical protein